MYYIRLFSALDGRWVWRAFSPELIRQLTSQPGKGLLSQLEATSALALMREADCHALFESYLQTEDQAEPEFIIEWQPPVGYQ